MIFYRLPILGALLLAFFIKLSAKAIYYETLPKGRKMPVFRLIHTNKISSSLNHNAQEEKYFFKLNLNSKNLENFSSYTKYAFDYLKKVSPEAYSVLTLGGYEAAGTARVQVRGFGFAYGLTNTITTYATLPWWDAQANLEIKKIQDKNLRQVQDILSRQGDSAQPASEIAQQINQLNIESTIQSIIVNGYGYKPLGSWRGKGFGDLKIGFMHRLTDWKNSGLAWGAGIVAPTGRTDDPDLLQDYGFGDGQWDLFAEFGGGHTFKGTRLGIDSSVHYTYQLPSHKEYRIPENRESKFGTKKDLFREKLGNAYNWNGTLSWSFAHWLSLATTYSFTFKEKNHYRSPYQQANQWFSDKSKSETHSLRTTLRFNTINMYHSNNFFFPMNINLHGETTLSGKNTVKYNRYDIEFRFFF